MPFLVDELGLGSSFALPCLSLVDRAGIEDKQETELSIWRTAAEQMSGAELPVAKLRILLFRTCVSTPPCGFPSFPRDLSSVPNKIDQSPIQATGEHQTKILLTWN